jgi:hypothetical protein
LETEAFAFAIISMAIFGSPLKIATRAAMISRAALLPSLENLIKFLASALGLAGAATAVSGFGGFAAVSAKLGWARKVNAKADANVGIVRCLRFI